MAALYRRATADLARAQRDWPGEPVHRYLNGLVARGHGTVYRRGGEVWKRIRAFYAETLPRTYRESAPYLLASAALLFVPALVSYFVVLANPDAAYGPAPPRPLRRKRSPCCSDSRRCSSSPARSRATSRHRARRSRSSWRSAWPRAPSSIPTCCSADADVLQECPLFELEVALDQGRAEAAGHHVEAQHAAPPQQFEALAPACDELLGGGPFVGARRSVDR